MSLELIRPGLYAAANGAVLIKQEGADWWLFHQDEPYKKLLTVNDLVELLTSPTFPTTPLAAVPALYARLEMRRATTINNGASGAGWFNVQPLNTVAVDEIGIVLAANLFTIPALPAGYSKIRMRASAPAYRVGLHQLTAFNVTDGVTRIAGTSEAHDATTVTQTRSIVTTELQASTQYRLDHYTQQANAVGLGQAANSGTDEVYAVAEFWMEQ